MKDASLTEQKNVQHYSQYYFSSRNMERCFHKINAKPTAFIPCYNCKSYYALLKRTKKISYFYGVNIGLLFSVYCPNYDREGKELLLLNMPLEAKLYATAFAKTVCIK